MEVNTTEMSFPAADVSLGGTLAIPPGARGLIVLVDCSGCRLSPHHRQVAEQLHRVRLATLLLDLLTPEEVEKDANTGHWRFDVEMLSRRLRGVTSELRRLTPVRDVRIGYFATGTGAAAALIAAAESPQGIGAVVACGGRPDLAAHWLPRVHAPALVIVGRDDDLLLALNRDAVTHLRAVSRLEVVEGATHRFEDQDVADEVERLAAGWFTRYLLHSGGRWLGPRLAQQCFRDRTEAGHLLTAELRDFAHRSDVIVLGLPRGGVPVAYEIARALGAELDVLNVRKLGFPGHEELALGAIATGGVRVLNPEELRFVSDEELEAITRREQRELGRRERRYREARPAPKLHGRTVILVDDGLATGATMRAAISAVRTQQPAAVIVAVPTAPADTCSALASQVDELVCLVAPELFFGVGQWYEDFSECSDSDVRRLVKQAAQAHTLEAAS